MQAVLTMQKITVIDGHPDPTRAHLVHALADHYAQTAQEAGNAVRIITVADLEFPLLRVPADFWGGEVPEAIRDAQADMRWADHLVVLYPLWMSDMPAVLKAFIEQALRPGLVVQYGAGPFGLPKRLFTGKSARIIVTMGMPPIFYRAMFRAHTVKAFAALLRFGGVAPVRVTLLGGLREGDTRTAARWIERVGELAVADGSLHGGRRARAAPVLAGALVAAGGAAAAVLLRSRQRRIDRGHAPAEPAEEPATLSPDGTARVQPTHG